MSRLDHLTQRFWKLLMQTNSLKYYNLALWTFDLQSYNRQRKNTQSTNIKFIFNTIVSVERDLYVCFSFQPQCIEYSIFPFVCCFLHWYSAGDISCWMFMPNKANIFCQNTQDINQLIDISSNQVTTLLWRDIIKIYSKRFPKGRQCKYHLVKRMLESVVLNGTLCKYKSRCN